jgi:hypothetical protein
LNFTLFQKFALKSIRETKVTEIEEAVAEIMKHAPSQKDGPKYKKVGIHLFFMVGLHT